MKTYEVNVGGIVLGGDNPIRVQSMTTTDTADIVATADQVIALSEAGCDYVRVTVVDSKHVEAMKEIRRYIKDKGLHIPLIADVHYSRHVAFNVVEYVDKVRVNPGNYADKNSRLTQSYTDEDYNESLKNMEKNFTPLIEKCRSYGTAIRVGVNHGSLSDRIMYKYGDTALGMVMSAMEFLEVCHRKEFFQVVVSLKASCPIAMIEANKLFVDIAEKKKMYYPLHLGLTEAGNAKAGRVKSSIAIGTLLREGIGDTVRVSLTEDSVKEVPVVKTIVKLSSAKQKPLDELDHGEKRSPQNFINHREEPVVLAEEEAFPKVIRRRDLMPDGFWKKGKGLDVGSLSNYEGEKKQTRINCGKISDEEANLWRYDIEGECCREDIEAVLKKAIDQNYGLVVSFENWDTKELFYDVLRRQEVRPPLYLFIDEKVRASYLDDITYLGCYYGPFLIEKMVAGVLCQGMEEVEDIYLLLQGGRLRTTITEFVSCPSCGRTLFNLEEVTERIKQATDHLSGVRIAVMGCIVNGPGEMADADYGYVGAAPGKVTLYRCREIQKKNIDEEYALDELINLIKEDGLWKEREEVLACEE